MSPAPPPLRTARARFPACRSSRWTCGHAGRSADPQAQVVDGPLRFAPVDLVPAGGRRATVVRCRRGPTRADRVSPHLPACSPDSTRGKSAPFPVGYRPPWRWPDPCDDRRAFAASHLLSPLGMGLPGGRLRRGDRPPLGLPVFHQLAPPTPSGPPLPRWAAVLWLGRRQHYPPGPRTVVVRASQPLWPVRLHEVSRGSPCDP